MAMTRHDKGGAEHGEELPLGSLDDDSVDRIDTHLKRAIRADDIDKADFHVRHARQLLEVCREA